MRCGWVHGRDDRRRRGLRIGLVQERVADVDAGMARVRALAEQVARRSPTAMAAFKRALLDGLGRPEHERLELERQAYEQTVARGDAAIGRESFAAIRRGEMPPWGPRSVADGARDRVPIGLGNAFAPIAPAANRAAPGRRTDV